jgi:hypothetical protein
LGEARKTISIHTDNSPENGLVPGFPLWIGASANRLPLLYDLEGTSIVARKSFSAPARAKSSC